LKELSISQYVGGKTSFGSSTPTNSTDAHFLQSSTKLNGNQQPGGNRRKGKGNHKGERNDNKTKDNDNNDILKVNDGEGKKEK
jgi:hypothetical protein